MNKQQIISVIKERISELQGVKQRLEASSANAAEGLLGWKMNRGKPVYILRENPSDSNGFSLGSKESNQLTVLAEKYRNRKYLNAIEAETSQLNKCLRNLETTGPWKDTEKVWEELPEQIRNLTVPAPLTDEDFARRWQNKTCYRKKTVDESPYRTMRGEYVRSKSECIIADRLYIRGIPYHYEINHTLVDEYGCDYIVQPDFTILNKRTGEELVWEHLGMMGDASYCEDNLPKLNDYVRSGYIPGRNLILSFESSKCPLSALYINTMMEKYLL